MEEVECWKTRKDLHFREGRLYVLQEDTSLPSEFSRKMDSRISFYIYMQPGHGHGRGQNSLLQLLVKNNIRYPYK